MRKHVGAYCIARVVGTVCRHGKVFHQILGFATGVTCGAEAADLYLHELLREEFMKVSAYIHTYKAQNKRQRLTL